MTHIFISYAHDDKVLHDQVFAWLTEKGFANKEIWTDYHIENGNDWNKEIFQALNNAFAVVVIVTNNLLNSQFCTIEWSYALGQGIPIFPLVLENVDFARVHAPLAEKQRVNGMEGIPDVLAEQLKRLRSTSPEVYTINGMIFKAVFNTHRRLFILNWLGDGVLSMTIDESQDMLNFFVKEAAQAQLKLEKLMLDKAYALNGKQHRLCWQLVDFLDKLARLQPEYTQFLPKHISEAIDSAWIPALNYFGDGFWDRARKIFFSYDLNDSYNRTMVFAEMVRAFPMLEAWDIDEMIGRQAFKHNGKTE